jgi:hypothetical protein
MSRWIKFAVATVLGVAVVSCGANGGDPVAGQQIPPGQTDSPQQPAGSAESGSGSGQGGSDGGSDSVKHDRKVGLPESIRITEISPQDFEQSVIDACGSKFGAPGCLTVTYPTVVDPSQTCGPHFSSKPPAVSADGNGSWIVSRGSSLTWTTVVCPETDDSSSPAPEDTMSPAPDDEQMSTSDSPTASP